MPEYRLTSGTHRREDGSVATPGDIVELTERQYEQFGHYSFDRVSESDEPDASGDIPDDWDLLRTMAVEYDGDDVHGSMSQDDIVAFFEGLSETEVAGLKQRAIDAMETDTTTATVSDDITE